MEIEKANAYGSYQEVEWQILGSFKFPCHVCQVIT